MTEAESTFDSHKMATMDSFGNPFSMVTPATSISTSIADHIDYQLSQINPSYTNTINAFIQNHTLNQDLIDRSNPHIERVVEWSPNKRYTRLNTLLGKGAFKVVHKAIDLEEGYEVAWNVLHVNDTIGHDNNKDVRHEIEILKSVRHPNIIAFHDAWISDSRAEFIFVTELMTSGTLREYIRKLNLPNLRIVKRWSRQILKGLAYLHGHNPPIIHRDIKCDNIFINGAHGEIKIGDLGTAENMWFGDKKYTLIGTPEFMAPEMYEEEGYNEKVDLYAFGMCLIEMTTGEYPYAECTNTAQIYKKVCQHIKPESLAKIQNPQVLEVVNSCLAINENERLSAQELLECSFLAVEPDVVLLEHDPSHTIITLQVVFKGSDKLSVKFEFNIHEDTAEEVVAEMIEEQVLPQKYQQWITNEINRILRDLQNDHNNEDNTQQSVWRRENDIRSELEKSKYELANKLKRIAELEKRYEYSKQQALIIEEKEMQALLDVEKAASAIMKQQQAKPQAQSPPLQTITTSTPVATATPNINNTTNTAVVAAAGGGVTTVIQQLPQTQHTEEHLDEGDLVEDQQQVVLDINKAPTKEYPNSTTIDEFVYDTAKLTNRDPSKAEIWVKKLKDQDIMTVGDLRELLDEDWSSIGLTVFALRALKNMLRKSNQHHENSV